MSYKAILIFALLALAAAKFQHENLGQGYAVPGSEYIGKGFDFINGTAFCYTASCLTEGYKAEAIFDLEYIYDPNACTTKDIPRGSQITCSNGNMLDAQTVTINSMESLYHMTSESEGTSVGYRKRFSASQSYTTTKISSAVNNEDMTVFHTSSQVTAYTVRINKIKEMKFSSFFSQYVASLPTVYNQSTMQVYQNFIKFFGTNYVEQVVLGGRCSELVYMKNSQLSTFQSQGNSATESVKVHFFVRAGANNANSANTTSQASLSKSINSTEAYYFGGKNVTVSNNINTWIPTVQSAPLPLSVVLKPISDLLTSYFFDKDPNIMAKNVAFNQAMNDYMNAMDVSNNPSTNQCKYPCVNGKCQVNEFLNVWSCNCTGTGYYGSTCSNKGPQIIS